MIQLFLNGKLVNCVSSRDTDKYIKLGYTVKALTDFEAGEFLSKNRVRSLWNKLPVVLKKRVRYLLADTLITWQEKYKHMVLILSNVVKKASRFKLVRAAKNMVFEIAMLLVPHRNAVLMQGGV